MRVDFCTDDFPGYVGGPNAWLRRLLPQMAARKMDLRVLVSTVDPSNSPTLEAFRKSGLRCEANRQPLYTEDSARWFLERVAADPPAVFIPNCVVPAYHAARWIRGAGIATVSVLHSDDAFHRGLQDEFVCGSPEAAVSAVVCVSRFLTEQVQQRAPKTTLVRGIPYGVPMPQQRAAAPGTGPLRLVYVGRFIEEQKRISLVAQSLCRAAQEIDGVEAVLYGGGPDEAAVRAILASQSPDGRVRIGGRLDSDRVQQELLNSHALVLLSDYEGLPIALMEAMACGVVPICLRIRSGVGELVEDGATGLMVDDRDAGFVAAVRCLRESNARWQQLSDGARGRIEAGYEQTSCFETWVSFLNTLGGEVAVNTFVPTTSLRRLPPPHRQLQPWDERRYPFANRMKRSAQRWVARGKQVVKAVLIRRR
jgi:glycosyltransferase involved in cell wall biosynthesis